MDEPTKPLRQDDLTAGILDRPVQPVEAKIGPVGRLFGVLLSPSETFEDIKRKPTWLFPLILSIFLAIGFTLFFNWRVKPDWVAFMTKQIEKRAQRTGTEMSPADAQAQAEKVANFPRYVGYGIAIVGPGIFALVFCGVLALAMLLVQGDTTFKRIFSVYLWANCAVTYVVFQLVTCLTLMLKDRASLAEIDLNNPASISATNLGVLLPSDASGTLKALAGSADIFSLWLVIVVSIGIAKTSNSKRMTTGKAAMVVTTVWLIFVLIKVGLASLGG